MDNSPVGGLTFQTHSPTSYPGIGSIKKRPHCSPSAPMLLHMDQQQLQPQKRSTDELEAVQRHQRFIANQQNQDGSSPSNSPPRDSFIRAKRLRTGDVGGGQEGGSAASFQPSNSTNSTLGPSNNNSSSSSNEWMNEAVKSELLRFFMHGRRQPSPEGALASSSSSNGRQYHQALFTEEQVVQICERLLREQRHHLELDFQRILNQKLADQYDAFRRFTQDQMHRQMQEKREDELASYFS